MEFSYGSDDQFNKGLRNRVVVLTGILILGICVLVVRLWYLQVIQGGDLKALSESNRLRQVEIPDYRGNIYDRKGVELVSSRPSFDIAVIREDTPDLDTVLAELGQYIKFNREKVKREILTKPSFVRYVVAHDVTRNEAARVEEHRYELPGVSINVRPIRIYKHGSFAAHLLGYLGEISPAQMKEGLFQGYRQGDIVGKYGVEKTFEPLLRGRKGKKIVEVDAAGRELKVIKKVQPGVGRDLKLSIDYETQLKAESLLEGKRGAVVALRPSTGEVIAIASEPAFDLNRFAYGVERDYWRQLLENPYHPLNNRSIQGLYPPASTYKIVVAAAGLEEGVIDKDTKFFCPGYFKFGRKVYRCWNRGGHGKMDLTNAIQKSCDVYFYNVGLKLGVDTIAKWAKRFGLDRITGIALEHEKSGLIPTSEWKEKNRDEPWILGETLSIAIGQGFNLVTPLQMASVISSVANGGYIPHPKLLKVEGGEKRDPVDMGMEQVDLSPETLDIIRNALRRVVNHRYGTAHRARLRNVVVAGKTGTGQVIRLHPELEDQEDLPENFRDHAWFVAFAPYENPEIAVAVVVEHGGQGGRVAAPIAREVIKTYLDGLENRQANLKAVE